MHPEASRGGWGRGCCFHAPPGRGLPGTKCGKIGSSHPGIRELETEAAGHIILTAQLRAWGRGAGLPISSRLALASQPRRVGTGQLQLFPLTVRRLGDRVWNREYTGQPSVFVRTDFR